MTGLIIRVILVLMLIVELLKANEPFATVIIFRHGDSEPIFSNFSLAHQKTAEWPGENDQLTIEGVKQMVNLGTATRLELGKLLFYLYNPSEIRVRSTQSDRTIMSAQAFLAGLYPIDMSMRFPHNPLWTPSPISTVPISEDHMLALTRHCPKQLKLMEDYTKNKTFTTFIKDYDWVRRHVENNTGQEISPIFLADLTYLYDVLRTQETRGTPLPAWTKKIYPNELHAIANFSFYIQTHSPELARLMIGLSVKNITEDLIAMDTYKIPQRMLIYSAHDITIANLMNGMNLYKNQLPPTGAYLRFDLLKVESNFGIISTHVQATYFQEKHKNYIWFDKFGLNIPILEFKERYQSLFLDDRDKECWFGRPKPAPTMKVSQSALEAAGLKKRRLILRFG